MVVFRERMIKVREGVNKGEVIGSLKMKRNRVVLELYGYKLKSEFCHDPQELGGIYKNINRKLNKINCNIDFVEDDKYGYFTITNSGDIYPESYDFRFLEEGKRKELLEKLEIY